MTLAEALRNPYAFPGGYEIAIYLSDGERICHKCARENYRQIREATRDYPGCPGDSSWRLGHIDVYWEGPSEQCVQCGIMMESEYGDPEEA